MFKRPTQATYILIQRISNKIARTWRKSLYLSNSETVLYGRKKAGDAIVLYHGVTPLKDNRFHTRSVSRVTLRKHMLYFKREFRVVSLKEMFETPNPGIKRVAITFDDGLQNNFSHAAVILRRLNVPATFFVTAARSRGINALWPDALAILTYYQGERISFDGQDFERRPNNLYVSADNGIPLHQHLKSYSLDSKMNFIEELKTNLKADPLAMKENLVHWELLAPDHIRTLAQNPLFEIGSHAITHQNFSGMSKQAQADELKDSASWLSEITSTPTESVAFPDGDYSEESKAIAREAGYSRMLAVNYRESLDLEEDDIADRFGFYSDRSAIEMLHQFNSMFYAE